MKLRPYQEETVTNVLAAFEENESTVAVLPTGGGKTIIFAKICQIFVERGSRVLVLAHRQELVEQAADKIARVTGIRAAVEQADRKEGRDGAMIVIASVQSMVRRLKYFPEDHFGLIVTDECHRAVTATHSTIAEHFMAGGAKHLGVTATPSRGDKIALSKAFQSVAMEYEISDAIQDGFLVPIEQHTVETSIDFSEIRTTAGDFNQGDLSDVMSDPKALYEICGPTVEMAGDRPTLVFAVTVAHAHALNRALRDFTKARTAVLDGTSDKDERKRVIDAYKAGDIQFLVNCALFIEGFDAPPTALISMARPTKSSLLYKQCIGRGCRPLDGIVDPFAFDSAEVRRQAIADSSKPNVLILDFAGNAGRHKLCSSADVLDGKATEAELKIAKGLLETNQVSDVLEAFERAKSFITDLELKRMREQARKNYKTMLVDPFLAFGVDKRPDPYGRSIDPGHRKYLENAGMPIDGLDRLQAKALVQSLCDRRLLKRGTYKQVNALLKRGLDPKKVMTISFDNANVLISQLANNKWKEPPGWAAEYRVK